ncbi:MAG TPA: M20/M25/M40 family metallo-hydrolase [Lentzea sp.]
MNPRDLLAELIAIDSVNPGLVPGGNGETEIAGFCAEWFRHNGFEVHRLEQRQGRPSVVAVKQGTGGGKSLMLNGHIDTVGTASYDGDALKPEVKDGKMFGRGTFDMKGGVAAMMVAAAKATERPLRGDVIVACVADEEHGSTGTEEVLTRFTADAAIVTEPSHLEVTLAHKGFVWFEVSIEGKAAHGSRPELGVDAIAKAGHFLVALEQLDPATEHPLLGKGTVHASLISGGEEASTYPSSCTITLERRTVPGEIPEDVEAELTGILDHLAKTVPGFRATLTRTLARDPFEADHDAEIVTTLIAHLGAPPVIRAEPFWTDCALLDRAGIPCLLFGVDGAGAHAATEHVDLASLDHLTEILTDTITDFCG